MDKLILQGLTGDEQLALREEIETDELQIQPAPAPGGRAGEPFSIGIILLSKLALLGLSAFLLKKRRQRQPSKPDRIRIGRVTFETPKARMEVEDFEVEFPASNNSPDDLAQTITKHLYGLLDRYLSQK